MTTLGEWSQMVIDCENRERRMSEWEREFIESISKRLRSGDRLTERQDETLNRIWEKATARR